MEWALVPSTGYDPKISGSGLWIIINGESCRLKNHNSRADWMPLSAAIKQHPQIAVMLGAGIDQKSPPAPAAPPEPPVPPVPAAPIHEKNIRRHR